VIVLSDGYIANGAEPWLLPDGRLVARHAVHLPHRPGRDPALRQRDPVTLARPWAVPGTPGLSTASAASRSRTAPATSATTRPEPRAHVPLRAEKIQRIAGHIPPTEVYGDDGGVLVVGWGSTWGAIRTVVDRSR
jgi:2-oxoglutarate ferredoxin oxidoreductase subunit alpha